MNDIHFLTEQFPSPIGTVLLLTDDEQNARALDWEDYAPRMHQLLRIHYADVRLQPKTGVSQARRALEAYFAGERGEIDTLGEYSSFS
jgi:methylated-DNA-[protein]-cysteine S-methyltransferase